MKQIQAWLCIFHHIPDSGDDRVPLFYEAEYRLVAPLYGCVIGALFSLFLAGLSAALLSGTKVALVLLALGGGQAVCAVLLLVTAHRLLAKGIDDSQYQWCLAHHSVLGLPSPIRNMDKKQLGRYVEAMYIEESRARWARVKSATLPGENRSLGMTRTSLGQRA